MAALQGWIAWIYKLIQNLKYENVLIKKKNLQNYTLEF